MFIVNFVINWKSLVLVKNYFVCLKPMQKQKIKVGRICFLIIVEVYLIFIRSVIIIYSYSFNLNSFFAFLESFFFILAKSFLQYFFSKFHFSLRSKKMTIHDGYLLFKIRWSFLRIVYKSNSYMQCLSFLFQNFLSLNCHNYRLSYFSLKFGIFCEIYLLHKKHYCHCAN